MKINGMAKALRDMATLQQRTEAVAQHVINKTANKIVQDAKSAAPGSLSTGIFSIQSPMQAQVIGGDEFAAYVDFGTGDFAKEYVATLPPDVQAEAMEFFVNGKGKGHPTPFFFPSVFRNSPQLLIDLEIELQKLANN